MADDDVSTKPPVSAIHLAIDNDKPEQPVTLSVMEYDCSGEAWRQYVYPGGVHIFIKDPLKVFVPQCLEHNDCHTVIARAQDDASKTYGTAIQPGWLCFQWQMKDGQAGPGAMKPEPHLKPVA